MAVITSDKIQPCVSMTLMVRCGFCVGTQNEKDMLARMHMEQNAARKTKASLLKRLPA